MNNTQHNLFSKTEIHDVGHSKTTGFVSSKYNPNSLGTLPRIGITSWEQVLLYLPHVYMDYTRIRTQLLINEKSCYSIRITEMPHRKKSKRSSALTTSVPITDGSLNAVLVSYERYPWENMRTGDQITVEATAVLFYGNLQLHGVKFIPPHHMGIVAPQYRGKSGLVSEEMIFIKTREALAHHLDETCKYVRMQFPNQTEAKILERIGGRYGSLAELFTAVHSPRTALEGNDALEAAYSLCALEIINSAERKSVKLFSPGSAIDIGNISDLIASLPFTLTQKQITAVTEVVTDLAAPYSMHRLLSGECSSGKTIVTVLPAVAAQRAGARVAFLCPNTLIAKQTLKLISQCFPDTPVALVTGATGYPETSNNPILVGTTALLHYSIKCDWRSDFLIIDEQEKFSEQQRNELCHRDTNILEATATCIPRTAAIVQCYGIDESILDTSLFERDKVETSIIGQDDRPLLFSMIKDAVAKRQKVAIIYPLVNNDNHTLGVNSAAATWETHFPGNVGMLHGQLTDEEKHQTVEHMKAGRYSLMVSTTVLERGIDTSFDLMIVYSPDRYGVTALHQLRGRVARFGGVGNFILVLPEKAGAETLARLKLLTTINNGFELAEKDLEMRGFGNLAADSEDQSGISRSGIFFGLTMTPAKIRALLA